MIHETPFREPGETISPAGAQNVMIHETPFREPGETILTISDSRRIPGGI
jgi:hypothetical protein